MKASAVLLAGGSGSRLRDPSGKKKQYLTLGGKPLICWALETFQQSELIEEIVLVVPAGDEAYVRAEILGCTDAGKHQESDETGAMPVAVAPHDANAYGTGGCGKVRAVVAGGKERYLSVYEGLKAVQALHEEEYTMFLHSDKDAATDADFDITAGGSDERIVFIHDGARPFVTEEELQRLAEDVQKTGACVLAVPAKDTIKRADADRMVIESLKREELWQMQTPQVFRLSLVLEAHRRLAENEATDDAMVVSLAFPEQRILLTEGTYRNLKVTTPEDLIIAEALAERLR